MKPLGQAIVPQGSPGQDLGVSAAGNGFFGQPATAVASEMNATTRESRLRSARTPACEFVEATWTSLPVSTRTAELALPGSPRQRLLAEQSGDRQAASAADHRARPLDDRAGEDPQQNDRDRGDDQAGVHRR